MAEKSSKSLNNLMCEINSEKLKPILTGISEEEENIYEASLSRLV